MIEDGKRRRATSSACSAAPTPTGEGHPHADRPDVRAGDGALQARAPARAAADAAEELVWRMHFMFGTLAYTLAATDTVQLIAGCKPEDRYDARLLEERLTAFLAAGLHAPSRLRSRRPP